MMMMFARGLVAVLLIATTSVSATSKLRTPRGLSDEVIKIQANGGTEIDIFIQDQDVMKKSGDAELGDSCSKTSDCKEAGDHATEEVECTDDVCTYEGCRCVELNDSCFKTSDCERAGDYATAIVSCVDSECKYEGCRCTDEDGDCYKTSDCSGDLKCRSHKCVKED